MSSVMDKLCDSVYEKATHCETCVSLCVRRRSDCHADKSTCAVTVAGCGGQGGRQKGTAWGVDGNGSWGGNGSGIGMEMAMRWKGNGRGMELCNVQVCINAHTHCVK